MEKWKSLAAMTVATTVAACTPSQQGFKLRPALSLDGHAVTSSTSEYERGKQLLKEGRFGVAAQAFQAALFADGTSVKVLNALAVSYDELGRYDLSARYYQRALMLDPKNAQTINNLAVSLARSGAPGLAAKILADARPQLPNDKIIAANLKRAQAATQMGRVAIANAPLPMEPPSPPQVPRIEQTSPSTQQLITIQAPDARLKSIRASGTAPNTGDKTAALSAAAATTAETHPVDQTTKAPTVSTELLRVPTIVARISRESVASAVPNAKTSQIDTADRYARPAASLVTSELLAPPPSPVSTLAQSNREVPAAVSNALRAAPRETATNASKVPVDQTPHRDAPPALSESATLALARSRLGSRIAESENIQPVDFAAKVRGATDLAMARLGMRLEVANGAGRRYMAARMRSFLDSQGIDVARVTNANSFHHTQTVIAYREGFEPEATALAKMLAAKVELRRVADLPVDVRLILGHDLLPFDRTLEMGG